MAQITRSNIEQIRADVEAALKTIYAKHGVDVTVGRIMFNAESFRCKIEGNVRGGSATPDDITSILADLYRRAWMLGKEFDETKTYQSPSLGRVKVTGYNAKAIKYPFIVKQIATGKQYKITTQSAKSIVAAGVVA